MTLFEPLMEMFRDLRRVVLMFVCSNGKVIGILKVGVKKLFLLVCARVL